MDAQHWTGIAMVISALLLPLVTRYASGGVAAKEDSKEDRRRLEEAQRELEAERRSGKRWYEELVRVHGDLRHERNGRLGERSALIRQKTVAEDAFLSLDPLESLQDIINRSNHALRETPDE